MAPILELIKKNAVPVNVMRSAARGALPLPAEETLEVLGKDTTTPEVLLYYWQPENRRPVLMPALIENPAITENLLMELADTASRETVKMLLASARARSTPGVIEA